jgi:hypothetical protein
MKLTFAAMLREADEFLMGQSKLHKSLDRLVRRLEEAGVDFALAGGLAVGTQGHLRITVDIDILVTADGLRRFKEMWLGRGYVERFAGSKGVKDTDTEVPIDFIITGEYPGDGRPKPVQFPDPRSLPKGEAPYRILDLRTLVELKLASGSSAPDRLIDLADVIALIRANDLRLDFADSLDPSVRPKYAELWHAARSARQD